MSSARRSAVLRVCASVIPLIREMIAQTVENVIKIAAATEDAEELACLNIDWFTI